MKTPKADKQIAHIARLIQGEVDYFNGWAVSDELEYKACHKAAKKVAAYIKRQLPKEDRENYVIQLKSGEYWTATGKPKVSTCRLSEATRLTETSARRILASMLRAAKHFDIYSNAALVQVK